MAGCDMTTFIHDMAAAICEMYLRTLGLTLLHCNNVIIGRVSLVARHLLLCLMA